jgi:hypothetical protein
VGKYKMLKLIWTKATRLMCGCRSNSRSAEPYIVYFSASFRTGCSDKVNQHPTAFFTFYSVPANPIVCLARD